MVFHAFENQRLGTIPIAVGHAQYSEGLKYRVSKNCTFAGGHGWTHDFVFYASLTDKSRLMPVSKETILLESNLCIPCLPHRYLSSCVQLVS